MLVEWHLVRDRHPLGAFELLHVEDLAVQLGRVVDDDQHLGLGIEVHAGAGDDLVEGLSVGHRGFYTPSKATLRRARRAASGRIQSLQLALDLGLDVERRLAARHAPLVAGDHELAHLLAQGRSWRCSGPARTPLGSLASSSLATSASTSIGCSPRADLAVVAGLDELADLGLALACAAAGVAGGRSRAAEGELVDVERPPFAELVEQPECAREQHRRDRQDHQHDEQEHRAELHGLSFAAGSCRSDPARVPRLPLGTL